MSATEELQLQVDNLRHQLHQLQVENEKLRVEVSTGKGEGTAEMEQLREECHLVLIWPVTLIIVYRLLNSVVTNV